MIERTLRDCRVLVAEDEYLLADELQTELEDAGAIVLGPTATVAAAIALIMEQPQVDGAILDANLGGEMVFPAANLLAQRQVPFIFTTGYDALAIPSRFREVARCEKPISMKKVTQEIGQALGAGSSCHLELDEQHRFLLGAGVYRVLREDSEVPKHAAK